MAKHNHAVQNEEKAKLYVITVERDGEVFERQVTIKGIPLWLPQKEDRLAPKELVGNVVDIAILPPNEEAGFPEREAMIIGTQTTHWVVPIESKVWERQFNEMRKPVVGDRIHVSFDGKAKKASRAGWAPANLFSISFINRAKTEAAQKVAHEKQFAVQTSNAQVS